MIGFIRVFNSINTNNRIEGVIEMREILEEEYKTTIDIDMIELVNKFHQIENNLAFFQQVFKTLRSEV